MLRYTLAFVALVCVYFYTIIIPVPLFYFAIVWNWFISKGWMYLVKGLVMAWFKKFYILVIWVYFLPSSHRRTLSNVKERYFKVKIAALKNRWQRIHWGWKCLTVLAIGAALSPIVTSYLEVSASVVLVALPLYGLPSWLKASLANYINQTIIRLIGEKNIQFLEDKMPPSVRERKERIEDWTVRRLVDLRFRKDTLRFADRCIKYVVDRMLILQQIIRESEEKSSNTEKKAKSIKELRS